MPLLEKKINTFIFLSLYLDWVFINAQFLTDYTENLENNVSMEDVQRIKIYLKAE